VAVITRFLPIHNLPLPFVSLSGANLFLLLSAIGIVLSIARHGQAQDTAEARRM
jgi:cell division protein FtsW (lipid II flippase)